jgi:ABC-type Mn2+/Zn2+ transport system permease subunit
MGTCLKGEWMVGWLILFALMIVPGSVATLLPNPATVAMQIASMLFAFLFLIGLGTRAARGRAW